MNKNQQREYRRIKQRESRARRRIKTKPVVPSRCAIAPLRQAVVITANTSCKASVEEIAALPHVQRTAFMLGVSEVIGVLGEQPSS